MSKVTPFMMFNGRLEEAVNFYRSIFPDATIESLSPSSATFELGGQRLLAFDGGEYFSFSTGISLFIDCDDQKEVDYFWEKLPAGGGENGQCGWLTDRFGVSWQVVPKALMQYLGGDDAAGAARAQKAMLGMQKLIVEELANAYKGI